MYNDNLQGALRVWFGELKDARQELSEIDAIADTVERAARLRFTRGRIRRIEMRIDELMKEA